jgi:pyruvate/2-oxoglutarate dehydrogenase complex dihydrolipoamide acyltransferase (E2) component
MDRATSARYQTCQVRDPPGAYTSLGSQGAGILKIVPLLTTTIHYGMFDPSGAVDMRVSFDHRVLDGTTAAQSLADLEGVLLSAILHECTG